MRQAAVLLGALCVGVTLAACGSPVRAVRVDRTVANRDLTRSAVTTGELSWATRDVLLERGLFETFDHEPEVAIVALHRAMVDARADPDLLYALAETAFVHGTAVGRPEYLLAAAVYAWAFLFPEERARLDPFDPRFRSAADLYGAALAAGLASKDGAEFVPQAGTFALPVGEIAIAFDRSQLRAGSHLLEHFVPANQF